MIHPHVEAGIEAGGEPHPFHQTGGCSPQVCQDTVHRIYFFKPQETLEVMKIVGYKNHTLIGRQVFSVRLRPGQIRSVGPQGPNRRRISLE